VVLFVYFTLLYNCTIRALGFFLSFYFRCYIATINSRCLSLYRYNLMDEKDLQVSGNKSLIVFVHGFRSSTRSPNVADFGKCK